MVLSLVLSLVAALIAPLGPRPGGEVRTEWPTTYRDLLLPEALTLPRYYIAQGGTGDGSSLGQPAPMGEIEFDGQDRAVVIVGDSDVRTSLRFDFSERPKRFALLHASAVHPGYPANEFRRGSVRVDDLAWTALSGGGLDGVYRAEITGIVDQFIEAYSDEGVTVLGVLYNDEPSIEIPDEVGELRVVAPSVSPSTTGVEHIEGADPDPTAAGLFAGAPAGRCLVVESDGRWYLYVKPGEGDVLGGAGSPRLDMLLTDGRDQLAQLIRVGGSQGIMGTFPQRFLSSGVNLAHISSGPGTARGWRGLVCNGGFEANVRHERFTDWLCGSQDVRGNINIVGEGGKLAFVDAYAMNPGSDEGHKVHANVNFADDMPVGMDESENWLVLSASIQDLQGESVIGSVFNKSTVHQQAHQAYDDWYRVRRGRFVGYRYRDTGVYAGPFAFSSEPADPFSPASYSVRLEDIEVENFHGVSGNYAIERVVHSITNADFHTSNDYERSLMTISARYSLLKNSAIVMAPTSTYTGSANRSADIITIDGRFFDSAASPDEIDIVLDGVLIIAKENRTDSAYGGLFYLFRMQDHAIFPSTLERIRVWTRNCVIVSDVPRLRLISNNSDTPIEFLTFDGEPGFDAWVYTTASSPGTGNAPQFDFTDGFGGQITRQAFEAVHGPLPAFGVDPGVVIPGGVSPPELPLRVRPDGAIRSAIGSGDAPTPGRLALASGVSPYAGSEVVDMVPRYGPFGFGGASPADLADPFGVLDFSDILAFLGAYAAEESRVDYAAPIGVLDFSDVLAFLTAYAAQRP